MLYEGIIRLVRENSEHIAGYTIVKKELTDLNGYLEVLHPDEITYLNALKFNRRKSSYLLGRISAKSALGKIIPTKTVMSSFKVGFGVFQFPVIEQLSCSGFQVSITHCDAIGISIAYPEAHPIGVDIEKINPEKVDSMINMFTQQEITLTNSYLNDKASAYTLLWTVKESLSKILKTGMMIDFNYLELDSLDYKNGLYSASFKNFRQYKSFSIVLDSYIVSITCPKRTDIDLTNFAKHLTHLNLQS
ncbi:4'-phosphopantetheinyl transferase superfamily protein [Flavobacterium sp. Fl-318]|uniref:4'-phosphopantetheinyl transferase superfamily protein n=1 Tax=Flavobacterium cupriresistens TaxID=2893885 RepID=A0ABU4RGA2_9FLAO|nr:MULTISPECIES: 4'-phosphopantetheinyl transferase superfamily protein [unclassified Flavobacterium]MDX6191617.1 4'-phosphopantetheinyl transferase superfamily protein [Flavobacterium sp. Fl-318]UFH41564.1 4'-phosphopantetheinyl transferase superfamily protein [Flavobacterium sp. F-323]